MIRTLKLEGGNLMAKKTSEGNITSLPDAKEAKTIAFNKEHYGEKNHSISPITKKCTRGFFMIIVI